MNEHEPITYRRVRLRCGARVLSEAENWYVPARLTAEMNRVLETTDTPFGRAVAELEPYRQTVGATILWSPLPDGWEMQDCCAIAEVGGAIVDDPDALFAHRAILYSRDHMPIAEVSEVYQRQVLAFPTATPAVLITRIAVHRLHGLHGVDFDLGQQLGPCEVSGASLKPSWKRRRVARSLKEVRCST